MELGKGEQAVLWKNKGDTVFTKMIKSLTRSYFWWVKTDEDTEGIVKTFESCQMHQSISASAPVNWWELITNPWVRLHVEYLGPFFGKMFLVIVDLYSKWVEVFPVSNSTSQTTINCLRTCFATHGLPQIYVSYNGSCFASKRFELFMKKNGILCIKSAPYHPTTEGCPE